MLSNYSTVRFYPCYRDIDEELRRLKKKKAFDINDFNSYDDVGLLSLINGKMEFLPFKFSIEVRDSNRKSIVTCSRC